MLASNVRVTSFVRPIILRNGYAFYRAVEVAKLFLKSKILVRATNKSCLPTCKWTWWTLEVAVVEFFAIAITTREKSAPSWHSV